LSPIFLLLLGLGTPISVVFAIWFIDNSQLVQGKLIEIHFTTSGKIRGAKIQTCKYS
jgi:hypothetical protein